MKYNPNTTDKKLLYTSGNEYMLLDGTEYKGYYYKKNSFFYETDDKRLFRLNTNDIFLEYLKNKGQFIYTKYEEPIEYHPIITKKDCDKGFIIRYFVKKRNNNNSNIIEINDYQYNLLKENEKGINNKLYFGISLNWKISGSINDIIENNIIKKHGIFNTNQKTVELYNKEMNGLNKILSNYLEFSDNCSN